MTGVWLIGLQVLAAVSLGFGVYLPTKGNPWKENIGVTLMGASVVCWGITILIALRYIGRQLTAHPL